eukprot:1167797-Pyramimonas_sp.AAC.1
MGEEKAGRVHTDPRVLSEILSSPPAANAALPLPNTVAAANLRRAPGRRRRRYPPRRARPQHLREEVTDDVTGGCYR